MVEIDRRRLLAGAGAGLIAASSITKACAIDADVRHGTLMDVDHVVILMQENRGFDHYFGSMAGVRGFGDRFPIPAATGAPGTTVWAQTHGDATIAPFHLDTQAQFALMRAEGTPHTWPDTQAAWDEGRMSHWPDAKTVRAMGHYRAHDLPFQFALAEAFTVCDAYHCAIQTGTNSNRLFLWSGTNDPAGRQGGPSIGNSHDSLVKDGGHPDGYRWTTYVERLQAAGVNWRIYQDMKDNFSDNPLAGFQRFRDAIAAGATGPDSDLLARGMTTHTLDALRADVLRGTLPQVSWIVADAASSEHPAASSPAQGADYTARVLAALTANPTVWARTALLVMFDENDGFFDHVPPPAPPSRDGSGFAGESSVPTTGEYHLVPSVGDVKDERPELIGRPYGLGPRVPMYVVSPWSRGGWVNSEVFDHTSVIRFLEQRFGVAEPNISLWRRAVSGDLTSAFDFRNPNAACSWAPLPATAVTAARAAALGKQTPASPPADPSLPVQAHGVRRSRPLPYAIDVAAAVGHRGIELTMVNTGTAGAVLHVYDRLDRNRVPRRYTLGAGTTLVGQWNRQVGEPYDLWLIGPNGFHRHVMGTTEAQALVATSSVSPSGERIALIVHNLSAAPRRIEIAPIAYQDALDSRRLTVDANASATVEWSLEKTSGWYDLALRDLAEPAFFRRFAGRAETGRPTLSDPAMGGAAALRQAV